MQAQGSRVRTLLAIGGGAFLLILVARFPAARLEPLLERHFTDVSLQAVNGSVFSGQAARLAYQGIDLGPVRWQFRPAALLQGRLEYRLRLSSPDNLVNARVGVTLAGKVYGRELVATLPSNRWINHFSPVTILSSGDLVLVLETFELNNDIPQRVAGRLSWEDAAILDPVNLVLGQVALDIRSRDGTLFGTVTGPGELGLAGTLELIHDGRYNIDLSLQPGGRIDGETLEVLDAVAGIGPEGDYRIRYTGQL
jgi:general secretion pathway protein N